MYIIIAGMGQVGLQITETLLEEGHNLAVIEKDKERMNAFESMDVLSINGNAASLSTLIEAGISSADIFIGATGSDEVNIISSIIAKTKGCRTMARSARSSPRTRGASIRQPREDGHAASAHCRPRQAPCNPARLPKRLPGPHGPHNLRSGLP